MSSTATDRPTHEGESHTGSIESRLNWLRAGVLGANDGIVSVAGTIIGVAGATTSVVAITTAGIAALVAGAFSMAGGEYVSVSTQRDTQKALLEKERFELESMPEEELRELADIYVAKGVTPAVAALVARDLTEHDALRAHADAELGIDPDDLTSPWHAAFSSFIAFVTGALLPLLVVLLPLGPLARVAVIVIAVGLALVLTGYVSARLGQAPPMRAVLRNVLMGLVTMTFTYVVGHVFGTVVG